jgi:hypothetical protein
LGSDTDDCDDCDDDDDDDDDVFAALVEANDENTDSRSREDKLGDESRNSSPNEDESNSAEESTLSMVCGDTWNTSLESRVNDLDDLYTGEGCVSAGISDDLICTTLDLRSECLDST